MMEVKPAQSARGVYRTVAMQTPAAPTSAPRGERSIQSGTSPTKTCSRCGASKPLSAFHRNNATSDGLQSRCKDCHNEARRTGGSVGRPRKADALPTRVTHFDVLPDCALLGADAVARLLDVDGVTLTRMARDGRLPAPRIDSGRRVWTVGAIRVHLAAGETAARRVGVYTLGGIIRAAREKLGSARVDRIIAEAKQSASEVTDSSRRRAA